MKFNINLKYLPYYTTKNCKFTTIKMQYVYKTSNSIKNNFT